MYERYWRLERQPFRTVTPGDGMYAARSHQAALLKLRYLVEQRAGAALVIGDSGVGKTCVVETFLQGLASPVGPLITLRYPQLGPLELLSYFGRKLGGDFSVGPDAAALDILLEQWERGLATLREAGRHPVFFIDDAQVIDDRRVFQTLQLLLNYRHGDQSDCTIILCGQPELAGYVSRHGALQERMAFTCAVECFTAEETVAYIRDRLQRAGADGSIFDAAAVARIHELSGGSPRRINRLCDFALLVGYADQLDGIAPAQIDAVAEELHLAA